MKLPTIVTILFAWLFVAGVVKVDARRVLRMGTCTGSTESEIELQRDPDDRTRLEVEFDLDSSRPNRVWAVTILRNGAQIYRRNHRTNRWGEFYAEVSVPGLGGNFTAIATSASSSERCTAQARFA